MLISSIIKIIVFFLIQVSLIPNGSMDLNLRILVLALVRLQLITILTVASLWEKLYRSNFYKLKKYYQTKIFKSFRSVCSLIFDDEKIFWLSIFDRNTEKKTIMWNTIFRFILNTMNTSVQPIRFYSWLLYFLRNNILI